MRAHLSAEFLADYFEIGAFDPVNFYNVGDESRIQFDGKPRSQIDSEMLMRNQNNAVVRQDLNQSFANQFGVGVGKSFVGDLPNLAIRRPKARADGVKLRP